MRVFTFTHNMLACVVLAFNRGHAVKQVAKELEGRNFKLDVKDGTIEEIDLEDPKHKKGGVFFLTLD